MSVVEPRRPWNYIDLPSNRQGKEEIESVFQTPLCHILCDENAPNSARTVKPILRLWHAKLAFHPLSPKKKHSINAHYAETWGLFEIASLFVVFVCAFVCAPPPSTPLLPRLHSLFPRTPAPVPPTSRMHVRTPACTRAHPHLHRFPFFAFTLHRSIPTHCLSTHKGWTSPPHHPLHLPFTSPLSILPNRLRKSPTFSNTSPVFLSPLSLPRQLQNQPPSRWRHFPQSLHLLRSDILRVATYRWREKSKTSWRARTRGKSIFNQFYPDANLQKKDEHFEQ